MSSISNSLKDPIFSSSSEITSNSELHFSDTESDISMNNESVYNTDSENTSNNSSLSENVNLQFYLINIVQKLSILKKDYKN